jgi:adenylate kinase family enzyme
MTSTIILIGPMSAGKSTIAALLAEKLNLPRYEADEFRDAYYREAGYDKAVAAQTAKSEEGMVGLLRYWKPFEVYLVERMLDDYKDCIIDFGAGHTVHDDEALFARVQRALAPYPNVILLLPSPDLDESTEIVNGRFRQLLMTEVGEVDPRLFAMNEHFVKHPSNHQLAKLVVYTNGKTPEETCAEIMPLLTP